MNLTMEEVRILANVVDNGSRRGRSMAKGFHGQGQMSGGRIYAGRGQNSKWSTISIR